MQRSEKKPCFYFLPTEKQLIPISSLLQKTRGMCLVVNDFRSNHSIIYNSNGTKVLFFFCGRLQHNNYHSKVSHKTYMKKATHVLAKHSKDFQKLLSEYSLKRKSFLTSLGDVRCFFLTATEE